MNTEIKNAIAAAKDKAQYDACAKRLIGQKMVLANILLKTIDEFKGMSPEAAAAYIEGEPQIGIVPVNPGMTNIRDTGEDNRTDESNDENAIDVSDISDERVVGLNTEDSEINEEMIRFDIIFYVRMKDGLAQIIVNVEIQKNQPKDYKLLNRSIYYVSRMVSSQKGRDFVKSNYDDLKRVFGIWICLNMDEHSLDRYYLANEKILGACQWEGKMNLLNIVLIGLAKELPERDKKYELHRLLGAMLSDKMKVEKKIEIMENEYHIPVNDGLREDVNTMCNLGEGIEERAIERTTERVTEQIVLNMYENHFTLEQIALATKKSIKEIERIVVKATVSV